jgi:hypothetical protein
MADEDIYLQLLGGALVILSLMLVYCWWSKKNVRDGMGNNIPYSSSSPHGSFQNISPSWKEGLGGMTRDFGSLGFMKEGYLNFGSGHDYSTPDAAIRDTPQLVESMHGMSNSVQNRHPQNKRMGDSVTNLRWETDASIGNESPGPGSTGYGPPDQYGNRAQHRISQIIGGDVITPMKPTPMNACNSHSNDQLMKTNTEFRPQWGNNYMRPATTI